MTGPLTGMTIVELGGIGPGPFAAMMLADHGAEVIRIERAGMLEIPNDPMMRGRRSLSLDLGKDAARAVVRRLAKQADGVLEGYRPGVMERLGLGPAVLTGDNPRLVYGRVTGWGQEGPLAQEAGHDLNYLALSGLLHAIGRPGEPPVPPLNLVGDYAGGGMMLAFGMVAALLAVARGAVGRVIDVAMSDGAALIGTVAYAMIAAGQWTDERGANLLDGGAAMYGCYECADGRYVAVAALEPKFQRALIDGLGLANEALFDTLSDPAGWPAQKARIAAVLATRSRDDWVALFTGKDACLSAVLTLAEAPLHPHNVARGTFVAADGGVRPAAAPRFSGAGQGATKPRAGGAVVLADYGFGEAEIAALRGGGALTA